MTYESVFFASVGTSLMPPSFSRLRINGSEVTTSCSNLANRLLQLLHTSPLRKT